jgi:AcrR family transcriptional regulator
VTEPSTTETKGERTRRRLLELAVEQFGRNGFRATSVTEITRGAGLTQAASYAYFQSKGELFRAAVDTDVADLVSSLEEPLQETPIRELLPSMLVLLAGKLDEHPLAVRVLAGQEPDVVAELRSLPALAQVRARLAERLTVAQLAGEVRSDVDAERLATGLQVVLVALLTSMTIARGTGDDTPDPLPEADVIAGVLEVFDALLRPATLRDGDAQPVG